MKDYNYYDYQHVLIKKDKESKVLSYYKVFRWEKINRTEDKQYDDVVHVHFQRKHKISNKDQLQLLQVNMEIALNKIGRLEKTKHSKTLIRGLSIGLLFCVIIELSIAWAVLVPTTFIIGISVFICLLMAVFLWILVIKVKKNYRVDNERYQKTLENYEENIQLICNIALQIAEGDCNG